MEGLAFYLLTAPIFFAAGFVQGGIGFGYNIISVPMLTFFAPARLAVAMISVPSQLASLMLVWQTRGRPLPARRATLLALLLTGAAGTLAGTALLAGLDPSLALFLLGLLVLLFVLTDSTRREWRPQSRHGVQLALGVGLVTGLLSGLAGVSGPMLAPYTHTLRLDRTSFVAYLNLLFLIFGFFRWVALAGVGLLTWDLVLQGFAVAPVSLLGIWLGSRARDRIDAALFNRLVLLVLLITGLDLVRRGLHLF